MSLLQVEELVARRQACLDYIKRASRGHAYFLNTTRLRPQEIATQTDAASLDQRSRRFVLLGGSAAKVLEEAAGVPAVRAFAQMFEEFEYHIASAASQSMKYLRARTRPPRYADTAASSSSSSLPPVPSPSTTPTADAMNLTAVTAATTATHSPAAAPSSADVATSVAAAFAPLPPPPPPPLPPPPAVSEEDLIKPALYCLGKTIVYDYLVVPPSPAFPLDYQIVCDSVCDVFSALYAKFAHASVARPHVFSLLARADALFREHFLDVVVDGLATICAPASAREFRGLAATFHSHDDAFRAMAAALTGGDADTS